METFEGVPLEDIPHADYPHWPGRLDSCLRCSLECFCDSDPGTTECVFCADLEENY